MDKDINALTIDVIDSEEGLASIESDWDRLISRNIESSFYSTFQFVRLAWKHFHKDADQLFVLLLKRNNETVGIAPFRIETKKTCLIPIRVIRFIAEWGDGDRPGIVSIEPEEFIWSRIYHFLRNEFKQWDGIRLGEQPVDSPILDQGFFHSRRYYSRFEPETISFYISMTDTWEEYIRGLKSKTRSNWRKCRKRLYDLPGKVDFQSLRDPETMPDALVRFISLEQSSWKKNADFSVGGNEIRKKFYEELIMNLVPKSMVSIHFLTVGAEDIAGCIIFSCNDTLYGAQIAYKPSYSKYSPGVLVNAETLKTQFGTSYTEFDLLGLPVGNGNQSFKERWATGTRKTLRIMIYKISWRPILYVMLANLKKHLRILEHKWGFTNGENRQKKVPVD